MTFFISTIIIIRGTQIEVF